MALRWVQVWATRSVCLLSMMGMTCQAPRGAFQVLAVSGSSIKVLCEGDPYLDLSLVGWGPGWSWTGWDSKPAGQDAYEASTTLNTGAKLTLTMKLERVGAQSVAVTTSLSTDRSTDLTLVTLSLSGADAFANGRVTAEGGRSLGLPPGREGLGQQVRRFTMQDLAGKRTEFALEPAAEVQSDGALRILLATRRLEAGTPRRQRIVISLPEAVQMMTDLGQVPQEPGADRWFPFTPEVRGLSEDEVGLADWLEKPAGKHGRIVAVGDRLEVNGRPIRIWGLNVCYSACAPDRELADKRADFYARNGVNAVRLHKYADGPGWAGIQSATSFEEFDAAALDRMDYFVAALKKRGIYVKLSPTFGVALGREDRDAIPYLDEFGSINGEDGRVRTGHGAIFLSRELQDLQIRQTQRLLRHRNPYTGLTYAEDPAVMLVEMFNEDSALFYGTMDRLQKIPTLRRRAGEGFTAWLRARYGTEARLLAFWGQDSLNTFRGEGFSDESWDRGSILPVGNPWFFDPDQLSGSQASRAPRLRDTMLYLYELQNQFYDRFSAAIRETGYRGEIMASNWIAGRAESHFYNLHSDARIGLVDRHNYFGGGEGSQIHDGSMLPRPGSGILSMGMSQVANRPFSLSEWIHVFPNEWGAEGVALLSAYGMGLQGWDVSFIFQNGDRGDYSERIGRDLWDATAPQVMGLFPAVARQIYRGDVRESSLVIPRFVHLPSLLESRLGFDDRATAEGDVKTSDSTTVPLEALAIGKCVVEFVPGFKATPAFDVKPFLTGGNVQASTRQLTWFPGSGRKSGSFTIQTPGTQALVGFVKGKTVTLPDVDISCENSFAAIYVTARSQGAKIAQDSSLLITALARARNTGMRVYGSQLLARGEPPVLLEPVVASIRLKRLGSPVVHVLDHSGRRTGRTVPVRDGVVRLDTGRDRAIWYLVTY